MSKDFRGRLFVVFLLFLLAVPVSAQQGCSLRCWLRKLKIYVPDQQLQEPFLGTTADITIRNLTIWGIDVATIDSSRPTSNALSLTASGLQATIFLYLVRLSWRSAAERLTVTSDLSNSDYLQKVQWLFTTIETYAQATASDTQFSITINFGTAPDGLLDSTTASGCAATITISDINFSGGGITAALLQAFKDLIRVVLEDVLPGVLCDQVVVPMIDTNVTRSLQKLATTLRPYIREQPRANLTTAPPNVRSMHDNAVVDMMEWALDDLISARGINWALGRLTQGTGVLRGTDVDALASAFMGKPFSLASVARFDIPVASLHANIEAGILDVGLEGLTSWDVLRLFVPDTVDAYSLYSTTAMQTLTINVTFFVNVTTGQSGAVTTANGTWLYERGQIHILTTQNRLRAYQRTFVDLSACRSLNHNQVLNLDCFLAVFKGASIDYLNLNASLDDASLYALGGDVEADLDKLVDDLAATLVGLYKPVIPAFLNGVLVTSVLGFVNPFIGSVLSNRSCHVADEGREFGYVGDSTAGAFVGAEALAGIIVGGGVFALIGLEYVQRKHKEDELDAAEIAAEDHALEMSSVDHNAAAIEKAPPKGPEQKLTLLDKSIFFLRGKQGSKPCLMCDERISLVARVVIPILLLSDIALFISSNTGIGASVVLQLVWQSTGAPGHHIETSPLFEFGLVSSIRDMWTAGVYPLAILIAVFSGAWPYFKLVAALACWSIPGRILKSRLRGRILVVLDMLGKWSLLDAYVMTIMIVSFHFFVPMPKYDPDATVQPVALAVLVIPCWGFISFLIATIISLVSSHIILAYHEKVESLDHPDPDNAGKDPATGRNTRVAVMPEFLTSARPWVAWTGRSLLTVACLVTFALVIVGAVITSIAFEFRGAAGVALEQLLNQSATRTYSLIDVGAAVPKSSPEPNAFGPVLIVIVFLLTAFIIPALHMLALVFVWCVPMTLKYQRWSMTLVNVLNAWSCIDVYIVSMAAALLEIRQFAGFMVGDACNGINAILEKYYDQDMEGSPICFEVIAKLTPGSWPLIVAIFSYFTCTLIVMKVCVRVIEKRVGDRKSRKRAARERRRKDLKAAASADEPYSVAKPPSPEQNCSADTSSPMTTNKEEPPEFAAMPEALQGAPVTSAPACAASRKPTAPPPPPSAPLPPRAVARPFSGARPPAPPPPVSARTAVQNRAYGIPGGQSARPGVVVPVRPISPINCSTADAEPSGDLAPAVAATTARTPPPLPPRSAAPPVPGPVTLRRAFPSACAPPAPIRRAVSPIEEAQPSESEPQCQAEEDGEVVIQEPAEALQDAVASDDRDADLGEQHPQEDSELWQ